jgi:hypothetical protein
MEGICLSRKLPWHEQAYGCGKVIGLHTAVTDESNVGFDLLKVTPGMGIILEKRTKQACIPMAQIHPSNVLDFLVKGAPTWYPVPGVHKRIYYLSYLFTPAGTGEGGT